MAVGGGGGGGRGRPRCDRLIKYRSTFEGAATQSKKSKKKQDLSTAMGAHCSRSSSDAADAFIKDIAQVNDEWRKRVHEKDEFIADQSRRHAREIMDLDRNLSICVDAMRSELRHLETCCHALEQKLHQSITMRQQYEKQVQVCDEAWVDATMSAFTNGVVCPDEVCGSANECRPCQPWTIHSLRVDSQSNASLRRLHALLSRALMDQAVRSDRTQAANDTLLKCESLVLRQTDWNEPEDGGARDADLRLRSIVEQARERKRQKYLNEICARRLATAAQSLEGDAMLSSHVKKRRELGVLMCNPMAIAANVWKSFGTSHLEEFELRAILHKIEGIGIATEFRDNIIRRLEERGHDSDEDALTKQIMLHDVWRRA